MFGSYTNLDLKCFVMITGGFFGLSGFSCQNPQLYGRDPTDWSLTFGIHGPLNRCLVMRPNTNHYPLALLFSAEWTISEYRGSMSQNPFGKHTHSYAVDPNDSAPRCVPFVYASPFKSYNPSPILPTLDSVSDEPRL